MLDLGGGIATGVAHLLDNGATHVTIVSDHWRETRRQLEKNTTYDLNQIELRGEGRLPLADEEASFDVILCHDLGQRLATDVRWLSELRRLLKSDGYLVSFIANPDGVYLSELISEKPAVEYSYTSFVEGAAPHFGAISVFGQVPLVGHLFFDFSEGSGDPGLIFDRALLPEEDETPAWYCIVCGPLPQARDELSIVQIPVQDVFNGMAQRQLLNSRHLYNTQRVVGQLESDLRAEQARQENPDSRLLLAQAEIQIAQMHIAQRELQQRLADALQTVRRQQDDLSKMTKDAQDAQNQLEKWISDCHTAEYRLQELQQNSTERLQEAENRANKRIQEVVQNAEILLSERTAWIRQQEVERFQNDLRALDEQLQASRQNETELRNEMARFRSAD